MTKKTKITRVIGIDFGTSTTVVAYRDYLSDGAPAADPTDNDLGVKLLHWEYGGDRKSHVPTLVRIGNGQCEYGWEVMDAEDCERNFKMELQSDNPKVRAHALTCVDAFFGCLWEHYRSQRELPPACTEDEFEEVTYVSFPTTFTPDSRVAIFDAASRGRNGSARFPRVDRESPPEPVAALRSLLTGDNSETQGIQGLRMPGTILNVLVIDMGAGTTDLALIRYVVGDESGSEVLLTWPGAERSKADDGVTQRTFGGREVDVLLTDYLYKTLGIQDTELRKADEASVKEWKERKVSAALGRDRQVSSVAPGVSSGHRNARKLNLQFGRTEMGEILGDYLPRFPRLIAELLEQAENLPPHKRVTSDNIDLIALTGGHSLWYFADDVLLGRPVSGINTDPLKQRPLSKIHKEPSRILHGMNARWETVARGLALRRYPLQMTVTLSQSIWLEFLCCSPVSVPSDVSALAGELKRMSAEPQLLAAKGTALPASGKKKIRLDYSRLPWRDMAFAAKFLAGQTTAQAIRGPLHALPNLQIGFGSVLMEGLISIFTASTYDGHIDADLTVTIGKNQLPRVHLDFLISEPTESDVHGSVDIDVFDGMAKLS